MKIHVQLTIALLSLCTSLQASVYVYENSKGHVRITRNSSPPQGYSLIKVDNHVIAKSKYDNHSLPKFSIRQTSFDKTIKSIASRHRLDHNLIKAIIHVESSFNPNATSPKGAEGLMQLMPATAKRFGVYNSFNTEQNINGGSLYIKSLMKMFDNNLKLVLAAYNAGENNVKKFNGIPPFPETKNYVNKVSTLYRQYRRGPK